MIDSTPRPRTSAAGLYVELRDAIRERRLPPGKRVPPSRVLAEQLGVSRHTVTTAYGQLVAEGYLEGAFGAGTRVVSHPDAGTVSAPGVRSPLSVRHGLGSGWRAVQPESTSPTIDLRLGSPDPGFFPLTEWRRRVARELREADDSLTAYGPAGGEPELRAALAEWVGTSRGVQATEQQVIVTAGAKGAFDLLLTALVEPGSVVAMEDPGYPPFRLLAEARGARVVPVPVDDAGIIPEALPDGARALHLTPSHQFPLGAALSLERRHAVLEWAVRNEAVIIEDDYDSDFRFVGRPLEPLHLLDHHGVVTYVGTFSKSMSPALRLGYVVVPPSLAPALASLSAVVGGPPGHAPQRALAGMLDDGSMARHLHRCRRAYASRHARVRELAAGLGTVVRSLAGLHLTVLLESPQRELELIDRARQGARVAVEGLSPYRTLPDGPAGLCLGFGRATVNQLDEVAQLLQ